MKSIATLIFKLTFLGFLFFNSTCLEGQYQRYELIKVGKKYIYDGKEYDFKGLENIFSEYEEPLRLYNQGRSRGKTAKYLALGGLAAMGAGYGFMAVGNDIGDIVSGALLVMGGLLVEAVALGFGISAGLKLKKSRKKFNLEMQRKHGYSSGLSFDIGSTRNGVGVILRFG